AREKSAAGARGARRTVGARQLGLQSLHPAAREPGLRRAADKLSRLDRIRKEVSARRRPPMGPRDAERPGRWRQVGREPGNCGPGANRDLRWLLRWLRGARRRRIYA